MSVATDKTIAAAAAPTATTVMTYAIVLSVSCGHMLNDVMQSLIPAIFPLLKDSYHLDFGQIGIISLAFQMTASILQPVVGLATDRRAMPFSLSVGMAFSLCGLLLLSAAPSYGWIIAAVSMVGLGSAVFHPESSRVARLASGGRHGLAQAIFQTGGNFGTAMGPLAAAFVVLPYGQHAVAWFGVLAIIGIVLLGRVGFWYRAHVRARATAGPAASTQSPFSRRTIALTLVALLALMFSKNVYSAAIQSYYTFYLIDTFHVTTQQAQLYLFLYLAATVVGTVVGGPLVDRFGRKIVIWVSILGGFPFTFALPYASLGGAAVLTVIIGIIMASAFAAILVYAQELLPGRVGLISGLFFGLAFGMGGIGAAVLGEIADHTSVQYMFWLVSWLPLLGLVTWFIPNMDKKPR